MSLEQVESAIQALDTQQRRELARWFDEHRHELLPPQEDGSEGDILTAQKEEVLARRAEIERNPSCLEPFEEADLDQMIEEFIHARRQKASPGQS